MRFAILFLSIMLIFAGIAGVMYVDMRANDNKNKTKTFSHQDPEKTQIFAKKLSMREIDSITSAMNYSFTIHNAVAANSIDTLKKLNSSKEMF